MKIRKATAKDARRISYLIKRNTEEVAENSYSKKQKDTWIKANTPKAIKESLKNRIVFCAFQNNQLVGTIGLIENEIVGLYVSYAKRGHGIGKKLLQHVERFAIKNKMDKLELTSTPSGFGFYKKNGFTPHQKVIVKINGVEYKETKMVKDLNVRR